MARLLKYRFDLLKPGERLLCEGASEADVTRRIVAYNLRREANPKTSSLPALGFSVGKVAGGVEVRRLQ